MLGGIGYMFKVYGHQINIAQMHASVLFVALSYFRLSCFQEKDMRKSAEVEVEAKEAETRSLERRLTAALAAAASAEEEAATCVEVPY